MADKAAEQIKFETELFRLTAIAVLAVGGGSLSRLLGDATPLRLGWAGIGVFRTMTFMIVGWRLERRIRVLIAQIKETA
jgi:hypothetical protein